MSEVLFSAARRVAPFSWVVGNPSRQPINPVFSVQKINSDDSVEITRVGELWQRVYDGERGLLDLPDAASAVVDRYHVYSDYLAVFVSTSETGDQRMVAVVRIVHDSSGGLPIEQFFPLDPLKRHTQLVEPQRMIVDPEWRKRRFSNAPYGLSGLLFKAVIKRYLVDSCNTTLVIDAFSDSRESPLHAFLQMGAKQLGVPFHDTELASKTPSVVLLCSLLDIATKALGAGRSKFARYLLTSNEGE